MNWKLWAGIGATVAVALLGYYAPDVLDWVRTSPICRTSPVAAPNALHSVQGATQLPP